MRVSVGTNRNKLRLHWTYQGKRYFLYLELEDTPLNRTVAIARKAQIEGDLATGNFDSTLKKYKPIVSNPTVLELWAKFTAFKAKQCDPQTIEKYTALLGHLQNHFKSVSNISEQQAIKFAEYLESRISAAGVRERIGLLKACWDWHGLPNPWQSVKLPRSVRSEVKPFTASEVTAILELARVRYPWYADFIEFRFRTGMRSSEVAGLLWHNIDFDRATVTITEAVVNGDRKRPKTGQRTIPLSNVLITLLRDRSCVVEGQIVFPSQKGFYINSANFAKRIWKPLLTELELDYRRPYQTRHAFVSHAIASGLKPTEVADLTGHRVRTIYENYLGAVKRSQLPDLFD